MSTAKSSVTTSPRHAAAAAGIGFLPHCVSPDQAASAVLPEGQSPTGSHPHSHPGTPPSAAAGIDAAAAAWDAVQDGTASAPSAKPLSEATGMEVVGGPGADVSSAAAAVDNEDEAKVMAEFEAKAAAIELDKKKVEEKRKEAASEGGSAMHAAVVAADHVEIEVPVWPVLAA